MNRKIGEGSLEAFARAGLKELAKTLPAFADSIQPHEEPGMYGNPTAYDVSKQTGAVNDKSQEPEKPTEPEWEP